MTIYFPDLYSGDAGVSLAGALTACIKATQGPGYVNPYYAMMRGQAVAAGAFPTAYHFLEEGGGVTQARHAFSVIGKAPAMLDFEPMDPPQGTSWPSLADACAFIDAYRAAGGVMHFVYLPRWYWARAVNGLNGASLKPLADRGMLLWSSNYSAYTDASDGPGWLPYGGMAPTVWQYTAGLRFGGMTVDFSAFRGHYAGKQDAASVAACLGEFRSLMATGKYPSPPPPPVPLPETVAVPAIRGESAGRGRAKVVAAHLIPVMADVPATAIVTGTTPTGPVPVGTRVTIHAAAAPELAAGSSGDWVKVAQADLNKARYHLAVDGEYGPVTAQAAWDFQGGHGLSRDGVTGPATWGALGEL